MFKRWASFILICVVMLTSLSVFADVPQGPTVYNIEVTEDGGKYDLGYVEAIFKKDSMAKDMEPVRFTVQLYAENGVPYIDIEPSVEKFAKKVTFKVNEGPVEFYDIATGETVTINLNKYNLKVGHFSRYILID